jgi:GTPase SAR1 family protein/chorismate mutase
MSSPNDNLRNESFRKEIEKYKKEIEELKKEKNNLENERNDLKEKIGKFKDESDKIDKILKNEYNEEFVGKKLEEFYDIVINIKSIYSLATPEGWPIKWNANRKEIQNLIKNKELLKIGILGNGNIGKSFLLSRLLEDCIPSGYSVITEGLSIKFNCDKGYTILDSAGLQTPLVIGDNINDQKDDLNLKRNHLRDSLNEIVVKDYENLYKDKTQTENFIQNLILYLSDMLLIVVGKITFNEQRLINKIKKEIELSSKDEDKKKQIFIIHNLLNFQKKHQVENHIKDTLMKSASFKLLEKKDIVYSDKKGEERFFFV